MALKSKSGVTFGIPEGIELTGVYVVFDDLSRYNKNKRLAEGTIEFYISKQARRDGSAPFRSVYIALFDLDFDNHLTTKGNTRHNDIAKGIYQWLALSPPIVRDGVTLFDPQDFESDE